MITSPRRFGAWLSILAALLVVVVVFQSTPGASADEPSSSSRSGVRATPAQSPSGRTPHVTPAPADPGDDATESPNDNTGPTAPDPDGPDEGDQSDTDEDEQDGGPNVPLPTAAEVARVMKVQNKHNKSLLAIKGIVGVSTSLGKAGGAVIKVYAKKNGKVGPIPVQLDGIKVEVVKTSQFKALQRAGQPRIRPPTGQAQPTDPTEFFPRPVAIGISCGPEYWTAGGGYWAGTLGCRVKDSAGNVYVLSNNHVLAGVNSVPLGTSILQPGLLETGGVVPGPEYRIATLTRYIVMRLNDVSETWPNRVDAAIARTTTAQVSNLTPHDGYRAYKSTPVAATLGQQVQKCGRTTGYTHSQFITGLNWSGWVIMDEDTGDEAMFERQIVIDHTDTAFGGPGDSGSLVVTDANLRRVGRPFDRRTRPEDTIPVEASSAVGLLFAGDGTMTLANRIQDVLSALSVTLDGE